jgi:mono/diheme cytochrome c family protein
MKRILSASLLVALVGFAGSAVAQDAAAIYKAKCVACHGADGKKKGDLTALKGSEADVAKTISSGNPAKKMPAYKGKLSDAEISALAKFVKGGLK